MLLPLNILRARERSKVQILAAAQCFYKQVFGENLKKGAGSVRQDLLMYNLDLGNIAENKTHPHVFNVDFWNIRAKPLLYFLLVNHRQKYYESEKEQSRSI